MREPTERGKWLALAAAILGWMFDGMEMGLFPLVARPALRDLLTSRGIEASEVLVSMWFSIATACFLIGAASGGVLFGWLGDKFGRVRAMTLSVLTYATFSGLCGLATSPEQIVALRFLAALGMGGEWALGVALVMELWPGASRALMAGLIGAAANVGYLIVGVMALSLNALTAQLESGLGAIGLPASWVAWLMRENAWRIILLLGATPAVLTLFIRLFVPESHRWEAEHAKGATSGWATRDLLGVVVGAFGAAGVVAVWAYDAGWLLRLIGTIGGLAIATGGYLYPVWRYLGRTAGSSLAMPKGDTLRMLLLGASISGVALLGTWGSTQWAPLWADQLTKNEAGQSTMPEAKAYTQMATAGGATLGALFGALCGGWFGRRITYAGLCVLSLLSALLFFQGNTQFDAKFLVTGFFAGVFTAAFYGWLPLYLPELFRTSVRATAQGFCFNYGRVIAAVGTVQVPQLMRAFDGSYPAACSVIVLVYLVGLVIIWLCPETKGRPLPE